MTEEHGCTIDFAAKARARALRLHNRTVIVVCDGGDALDYLGRQTVDSLCDLAELHCIIIQPDWSEDDLVTALVNAVTSYKDRSAALRERAAMEYNNG